MRRVWLGMALGVLVACGSNAAEVLSTTTAPMEPLSTSTTATVAETTTNVAEVVSIPAGKTEIWEPGVVYATDQFVMPVSMTPGVGGWRSVGVTSDWFHMTLISGEPKRRVGSLTLISYRSSSGLDEVVEAITSIEGVSVLAEPASGVIAEVEGVVFDVEGEEKEVVTPQSSDGCSATTGRFFFDRAGYPLLNDNPHAVGIAACKLSRVWVINVDGRTLTVIGGVEEAGEADDVLAEIESLLDSMTFEAR